MSTTTERGAAAGQDDDAITGRIPQVRYAAPRPTAGAPGAVASRSTVGVPRVAAPRPTVGAPGATAPWGHPAAGPVPPAGLGGPLPPYGSAWSGSAPHAGPVGHPVPGHPVLPAGPGMRWGWLGLGLVAAIVAVVLIGSFAAGQRTMTVQGTAVLYGASALTAGSSCSMPTAVGTPVSIYDASGQLVGTASLSGYGTARNTWNTSYYYDSYYADSCAVPFTVSDVAAGDDHYRVVVGSGSSQGVGFSADQMTSGGVEVTVR